MTPLSQFLAPIKEREKLLKAAKRHAYIRNHKEFYRESTRKWKQKSAASKKKYGGTGATG